MKELARAFTPQAIAVLAAIMADPNESAQARVAAARELLDRGHGKPAQALAVSAAVDSPGPRVIIVTAGKAQAAIDAEPDTPTVVLPHNGREVLPAPDDACRHEVEQHAPAALPASRPSVREPQMRDASMTLPTVRIRDATGRMRIINRSDFDPARQMVVDEPIAAAAGFSVNSI